MKTTLKITVILTLLIFSTWSVSAQYSKKNTRNFLNKTSYVIGEAYDMVYYYGYYSNGYLSKAVNHQNYAKFLYNIGNYRNAISHSDLARRYALRVIYNSTNYWDNYYRPHYYSSYYPSHGKNSSHNNNYNNNNRPSQNNTQYGHRGSSTNVSSTTKSNNNSNAPRVSKYAASSSGNDLQTMDMEMWERNYYSTEERSLIGNASIPSERELETAVMNNNNVRRVSNDEEVMKAGIKDFSSDISTYKSANKEEAKTIAISRPTDFGTTSEVTRSTATRTNTTTTTPTTKPVEARPTQTATPTPTRQTESTSVARPAETRPTQTKSTETARPAEARPTQTSTPAQTKPATTPTRQEQAKPAQTQPTQTAPAQNQRTNGSSTQTKTSQPTQTSAPARTSSSSQEVKREAPATQKTTTTTAPRSR